MVFMAHIFISYAKKDTRPLAEKLYEALNAIPGLSAWMDMSLVADSSWAIQIEEEIEACDYMVVLLSPDVNRPETETQDRSFVLKEIAFAQMKRKRILPVMVQDSAIPLAIADLQYIDLTHTPLDPTPIVERVCKRFELQTPAQLRKHEAEEQARREREAEEKRHREAALQEQQRRQNEGVQATPAPVKNQLPETPTQTQTTSVAASNEQPNWLRVIAGGIAIALLAIILTLGSLLASNGGDSVTPDAFSVDQTATTTPTIAPTFTPSS